MSPTRANLYVPTYDTREMNLVPGNWVEYRWTVRAICEPFYFMWRMAEEYDLADVIQYQLTAEPIAGRVLAVHDANMNYFEVLNLTGQITRCREPAFQLSGSLPVADLRAGWKNECVTALKRFLELFPGHLITREEILHSLETFLKRG